MVDCEGQLSVENRSGRMAQFTRNGRQYSGSTTYCSTAPTDTSVVRLGGSSPAVRPCQLVTVPRRYFCSGACALAPGWLDCFVRVRESEANATHILMFTCHCQIIDVY